MDKVKIEIVKTETLERLVECLEGALISAVLVPELAGHENILAAKSRLGNSLANADLVSVDRRGIYVSVSDLKSDLDRVYSGLAVGGLPGSKSYAGDLYSVVKFIKIGKLFHNISPVLNFILQAAQGFLP